MTAAKLDLNEAETQRYCDEKALGLRAQGDELRGPCPIHRGTGDNFSLNPKKNQWYCHSKCGRGGTIVDLEQALTGADESTARAEVMRIVGRAESPDRRTVAEYNYTDVSGKLLFQCVRYEPKRFVQRQPDGLGGWEWNLDGVKLTLYRLPKVLAADTVYVCEGEKDVHTLEEFGLVATSNPMGASKWRSEYTEVLKGKNVIILPDNDAAGHKHAAMVAESLLGIVASVFIVEVPSPAKDVTEFKQAGGTGEEFAALVAAATPLAAAELASTKERWGLSSSGPGGHDLDASQAETQAGKLLRLAECAFLFHTPGGENYASIPQAAHFENWSLASKGFRNWLLNLYFQRYGRPPGSQAMNDVISTLQARAQFEGPERDVHVRVAWTPGCVYLDLANENWDAVQIDSTGSRVVQQPPVYFRRPKGMEALPTPLTGGSLSDLRQFINAPDDDIFVPVVAWLIGSLNPAGKYPLLCLQGEQGSAKSTLARILRDLLDPATTGLRTLPKEERDLMIAANNNWVLAFDNLSGLAPAISDSLCRLATGGGFSTRELYSDKDEALFDAMRPIILNGIDDVVTRQDLMDRSLIVSLPAITDAKRRSEHSLFEEFRKARPTLLGAVCEAVSTALRNGPGVPIQQLPRMADFAMWTIAAEPALPWQSGDFMKTYLSGRKHANQVAMEGDAVAASIPDLLKIQNPWTGTAAEILLKLDVLVTDNVKKSKHWPKSAQAMANRLRRAAPFMRAGGIEVDFSREAGTGRRLIQITHTIGVTGVTSVTNVQSNQSAAPVLNQEPLVTAVEGADTESQTDSPSFRRSDSRDDSDGKVTAPSMPGTWPELNPEI